MGSLVSFMRGSQISLDYARPQYLSGAANRTCCLWAVVWADGTWSVYKSYDYCAVDMVLAAGARVDEAVARILFDGEPFRSMSYSG